MLELLRAWSVWHMSSESVWRRLELWCWLAVQMTGESSQSSLGNTHWQAGDPAWTCELLDDAILGVQWIVGGVRVIRQSPSLGVSMDLCLFLKNGLPSTGAWLPFILCMLCFLFDFQFLPWVKPAGDYYHKICRCWYQSLQTMSKNEHFFLINHLVSGILV